MISAMWCRVVSVEGITRSLSRMVKRLRAHAERCTAERNRLYERVEALGVEAHQAYQTANKLDDLLS